MHELDHISLRCVAARLADRPQAPASDIDVRRLGGPTLITLRGEFDLLAAPALRQTLDIATTARSPRIVIDLRSTRFFDCSILSVLLRARRRALERGGGFAVICVRPSHLRLLSAADLSTVLAPVGTLQQALIATVPSRDRGRDGP
ncbi:STAS domain-containing protein [Streptomyces sp. SPB162]|uniref:STAS domain-containing protein n=1 Tax=Streptomyces sp. SPB162 TaxID=2940560 RepID=UPI00240590A3|nr:STAS domain-containing protein [Streptomyces sp. SPB162]MDF9815796.1 anti-sigma B factor antagonist [Streptomyces sp. SPB162]